jgi:hypothetical protein
MALVVWRSLPEKSCKTPPHAENTITTGGRARRYHSGRDLKPATIGRGQAVEAVPELSDASGSRWAFRATVYKSKNCKGFVGYGDADPSNVSPLVRGAEMRVAETRAVSRCRDNAVSTTSSQPPAATC